MANLIKKMSVRSVFGEKKDIRKAAEAEGRATVMRVMGQSHRVETGEGDNGPWVKFKGNFKGINPSTGEEFRSGVCFLPEVAADLLEPAVIEAAGKPVQFAFDIQAVEDDDSAVGYVYEAKPLLEADEADPLAALEEAVVKSAPKLAAPKSTTKTETK